MLSRYPLVLFICLISSCLWAQPLSKKAIKKLPACDAADDLLSAHQPREDPYKGMRIHSFYLYMQDSTALAVDLYLPKKMKAGDRLPTIVRQTRYWRRPQLRFPFSLFSKGLLGRTGKMVQRFLDEGYAIVNVDVRGSGASFGQRLHPWSPEEQADGAEILDWIVAQPWSNGQIGSLGVSYGGTAAEFLAIQQHPNLKAVALMFSLYDVYADNAFPGGIHNRWFTSNWGDANALMDANELPPNAEAYKWLIKGVAPVRKKKKQLGRAVSSHEENKNVHEGALEVDFRDDRPRQGAGRKVDYFSPHHYIDALRASGVAVYSYSGWQDGAYAEAAIKRHLDLGAGAHKLMLGPWEHGGAYNISPYCPSLAQFDHAGELLKFFDYHLKGQKNALAQEAPIHYYSIGAERWRAAQTWPPAAVVWDSLFLSDAGLQPRFTPLSEQKIVADHQFGTGEVNRWTAVNGKVKSPYTYADWAQRSASLLHFDGPLLAAPLEIVGESKLQLQLQSTEDLADIYVYLSELKADGSIHYITEGQLRASHRPKTAWQSTHLRKDAQAVVAQQWLELRLQLLPVAWQLQKGSRLRLSLGPSDKDIFEGAYTDKQYELLFRSIQEARSFLLLPVYQE
ncbi:putative hydrolase, CocE/NonD family [Saprospira grandis DSM 2844]|uniref:Putative hydrolase, CocE/NonD family n=1 Tax=Saprospira grandis DSM 2844 TaxID=694433 RepID=J1I7X1_9BACT|nr:CocE/NonD family hydrolase [Saprospira grandis]EJF54533.1 putative hydrolase, CocE/NonD family [Saprospira grandis DSM 2844]